MKMATSYPRNYFQMLVLSKGCGLFTGKYVVLLFQRYIYALQALITFQNHTLRWGIYILDWRFMVWGKIIYFKPYHQSVPLWTNTLQSRLLFSNTSLTNSTGRLHGSQFLGRSVKCNLHLFCASAKRHLCLRNSAQENNAKRSVHLFW